jgi:hypothetical protein
MHRKRISVDDKTMALVVQVRKALGLVHRLTHKNKHPFSTSGDEAEQNFTLFIISTANKQ